MENLTKEMLQKARECKTVEELLNFAKENDLPLTEEQATEAFNEWNKTGELADEELENVAGGWGKPVGDNPENLREGDYVKFKDGYVCENENCGHHVFYLDSPWYAFGEFYARCIFCECSEKVYRYNQVTRV